MAINEKFLKPYNPKETEDRIYKIWEESGFFNPDQCLKEKVFKENAETFIITLPPPNVTGVLHIGHAYENSLQDAIIRYQRMRGKKTLWVPGTDSAAIATQARVEKNIKEKEGKTRHDLGREELVKRVSAFAKNSEEIILSQIKKLGASLDWSRYSYTLDKERVLAVSTAFKRMYDAGLIYRGHRIINWDPKGQTTISDDEVLYKEEKTKFYYFKYGPFTIGTARPETKFSDKYVVIHPDDNRYKNYKHMQEIEVEWINGPIKATIIKDQASNREMGSGVMTITPWHSSIDFELAQKYNLEKEQIIDHNGRLLPIAREFVGMKITEAREKIVEKLQQKGLVEKIEENYMHNVATSERTGAIIEPQIMEQWFIAVDREFTIPYSEITGVKSGDKITLKQLMRQAVLSGDIEMPQENFRKTYFHWIDNLHDWNISRQIWFGHRIPVWYHQKKCLPKKDGSFSDFEKCQEIVVSSEKPICKHCDAEYDQEPDVLDTWFSSALWTFSTLGWPEKTSDLKIFHPTSLMSPAYEILPLWVSRMILMSGFHLGQVPFKKVLIHGLVRDKQGRKFSKSLGNGVNPLDLIEKFGADALRVGLLAGTAIGNDINFDEDKVKGYKHFANKIWNVSRFILTNTENSNLEKGFEFRESDKKTVSEFKEIIQDITDDMDNYRMHLAFEKIYHYFWHTFADIIIEEAKPKLFNGSAEEKKYTGILLLYILKTTLKLLHPFMPFITEEIWNSMAEENLLMVSSWPK